MRLSPLTAALLLGGGATAVTAATAAGASALTSGGAGGAQDLMTTLAIASTVWFAADKIIELLPISQNTTVQAVRRLVSALLAPHATRR